MALAPDSVSEAFCSFSHQKLHSFTSFVPQILIFKKLHLLLLLKMQVQADI